MAASSPRACMHREPSDSRGRYKGLDSCIDELGKVRHCLLSLRIGQQPMVGGGNAMELLQGVWRVDVVVQVLRPRDGHTFVLLAVDDAKGNGQAGNGIPLYFFQCQHHADGGPQAEGDSNTGELHFMGARGSIFRSHLLVLPDPFWAYWVGHE